MKPKADNTSNSARQFAWIGGACFLAGLILPAVNMEPWLPGFNIFILSFLGLVLLGGGSIPHIVACLLGASTNILMLITFIRLVRRRRVSVEMPSLGLVLGVAVLAPLGAIGGSPMKMVSYGYFAWLACGVFLVVGASKSSSAPSGDPGTARRQETTRDSRDGEPGVPMEKSGPSADLDASRRGFRVPSLWLLVAAAGSLMLVAKYPARLWVLLPVLLLFVLWLRQIPVPLKSIGFLARTSLLALLLLIWWPSARLLVRAVAEGDKFRVRICLALGVSPNSAVMRIPHTWYLGAPGQKTPLYAAIVRGDADMVSFLLDHGADPGLVCGEPGDLKPPLEHALAQGNPEVIRLIGKTNEKPLSALSGPDFHRSPVPPD